MGCIKKFVINRNDLEYLYTEKHRTFLGVEFLVYNGKNLNVYSPDEFYLIFGSDLKISIYNVISLIENKLLISQTGDYEEQVIGDCLNRVKYRLNNKNYINPNMGNAKISLLRALNLFNKRLTINNYDNDFDYEDEFARLCLYNDKYLNQNNIDTTNRVYEVQSIKNVRDIFKITKDARVRTIDMQEVL